jgi:C4-dicarboxylate-specific signal transduction histidine kinase
MIKENLSNLANYFQNDSKGKLIPDYLVSVVEEISKMKKNILDEAENLKINIKHIQEITSWQKSLSGVVSLAEKIYLPEIIDLAIKMCAPNLVKHGISLDKSFGGNLNIISNRNKLLQILVNLVQNAKESLLATKLGREKKISFIVKDNSLNIEIEVVDNGMGISADNLKNIFSFGFTTKKNGHGYGLHSSAIAAKELGGKLIAVSEGNLQGAKFILTLPLDIQHKGDGNHGK